VLDVLSVYLVDTMDEVLRLALAAPLPGRPLSDVVMEPVKIGRTGDDRVTH
jgi:hypothetical protein